MQLYDHYEEYGKLPHEPCGLLDQTQSFLDACDFYRGERIRAGKHG